jgi:hypothetical protein
VQEENMIRRAASRFRIASVGVLFAAAAALLLAAGPADAQAILKISDTAFLRFGALLQPQADWTQVANATNTNTAGYSQNLFIRRARFYFAGRFAKDVYFYFCTENANLGKATTTTTKALGSGFQLLEGFGEWRIADTFILDGGLMRVPYAREALKASTTQFTLDTSAYTYLQQTATQSTGGNRDTGFMVRGFLLDHRLEYRAGAFQGARQTGSHNSFRYAGRLQFNFFDREDMYSAGSVYSLSYAGSYLGDKKILAVGTGFDTQGDYNYYSGDVYAAIPTGKSGGIESTVQYQYISGGKTFTSLPTQNTLMVEGGYYIKSLKIAPLARYEQRVYNGQEAKNEVRYGLGLNYYPFKYNFNIKAFWSRVDPKSTPMTNQFTVQLQFYYF